jgi:phosphoribosylanthranilate isomerase
MRLRALRVGPGFDPQSVQHLEGVAFVLDAPSDQGFGGTGKVIDWDLAAVIVAVSHKPVILAGGLNPDNVADAIRTVRPYAVDVSSGVEAGPGTKDPIKLRDFVQAARSVSP